MVKKLAVNDGFVWVDDIDFEYLNQFNWINNGNGYYKRYGDYKNGKQENIYLHREITQAPPNMVVDHIDGNKKNNTRANLRICTQSENLKNSKSRGKGYFFDKGKGKWRVMLKGKHIAYCTTEGEAIELVRGLRKEW